MPATYDPIATTTLGSSAATITFSSIPSSYTDLRLVIVATTITGNDGSKVRFNNDSGTNYSEIWIIGNGSAASASRRTNGDGVVITNGTNINTSTPTMRTLDIFSYAGSTNKTVLVTESSDLNGSGSVTSSISMWRSTSAINRIDLVLNNWSFAAGTTATLYGILRA